MCKGYNRSLNTKRLGTLYLGILLETCNNSLINNKMNLMSL